MQQRSRPTAHSKTAVAVLEDRRAPITPLREQGAGRQQDAGRHDLDGIVVQRCDEQHALIVGSRLVPLTPTEYRLLVPLLFAYRTPVPTGILCDATGAATRAPSDTRRIYRHIDRMRSKLQAVGLDIRLVTRLGYMLLRP